MICEKCGSDSHVVDSRQSGDCVRRRRECLGCSTRWTTIEVRATKDAPTLQHMVDLRTRELVTENKRLRAGLKAMAALHASDGGQP